MRRRELEVAVSWFTAVNGGGGVVVVGFATVVGES